MKKLILNTALLMVLTLIPFSTVNAEQATIPNTFQSGTPAVASEVNANFTAVKTAVDDNDDRIADLESTVTTLLTTISTLQAQNTALQDRVTELEESNVMALEDYVSVDEDDRGPRVQLAGVNVQIVNGLGSTETINGLGNLIVGYDEINGYVYTSYCSHGDYSDQASCEAADEAWSYTHKTGSHNLVLGSENSYSQYGGVVAGFRNRVRNEYSVVTAGYYNDAYGSCSSVSGGHGNEAGGSRSSVSGGYDNEADGDYSSISGGSDNVSGGICSSVSGGNATTVSGEYDWAAGSLFEDQ